MVICPYDTHTPRCDLLDSRPTVCALVRPPFIRSLSPLIRGNQSASSDANKHTHTHTAVQQTLVNYFFLPCESLIAHINPAVRDKYSSIINQSSRQVLRLSFSCSAHIHPRLVANYTPLNRSLLVRPAAQSSIVQALRLTYSANRGKPKEHHKSLALCYWPAGVCIHPFTFILCALSCSLEEPGSNGGSPPPEPHLPRAHRSCLNNFTRTLSQNMQS